MAELTKILHVEDDGDIREIAKIALEMIGGFEIHQCDSGSDALACATDFAPDLFLLDFMMPDMDGKETLQKLRQIAEVAPTPAIFMTAKAHKNEIESLMACGAQGVIVKPFDPATLAEEIREIWQSLPSNDVS